MQSQVQAVTEELGALKAEIVNLKASHAGLHQSAVDSNAQTNRVIGDLAGRVDAIQTKAAEIPNMVSGKKVTLMEPKQVTVEEFSGGIADSRNKFHDWSERVHDKVSLYDAALAAELKKV